MGNKFYVKIFETLAIVNYTYIYYLLSTSNIYLILLQVYYLK